MELRKTVHVCQHVNCLRNGSAEVLALLQDKAPVDVLVCGSDCLGQCSLGPTIYVLPDEIWYCRVKPEKVSTIVHQHLDNEQPVTEMLHPRMHPQFLE